VGLEGRAEAGEDAGHVVGGRGADGERRAHADHHPVARRVRTAQSGSRNSDRHYGTMGSLRIERQTVISTAVTRKRSTWRILTTAKERSGSSSGFWGGAGFRLRRPRLGEFAGRRPRRFARERISCSGGSHRARGSIP